MTTIYHNPNCTKSRLTLEMLKQKNINPTVIKYLETPPDEATLRQILADMNISAQDFIRKGETEYAQLGLASASENELIKAMVTHPKLIERPVVITDKGTAIGRPPENVLEIL